MAVAGDELTIGQMASRVGIAPSAIRFYEERGIVSPIRSSSGHRRYRRSDIRRLSFVLIAQRLGFSLKEISTHLAPLPMDRAPSRVDWSRIASGFSELLDERMRILQRMRDRLDGCIGCGCLSLDLCALYNPDDGAAAAGPGPRHVLEDGDGGAG
ncbi:MAG: redox-sensitive transcriptional activator SoxR [Pseudomonadota bacterium]|jgi:MerR family redox-sensitive transcriptional activator SoxR